MKKYFLLIYYGLMSLIFSLQSIVYINDLGDQNWFRVMFSKYSFLEFALFRYQTWSSRLLIESVTMFMAAHYLIFDLCMFISVILFFYYFNGVFLKDEKYYKLRFVTPVLFLLAFPSVFFTSAGLITTVTNYLFPMVAFMGAWYYLEKRKKGYFILSLLLMVFACMQEQFTIYALLLFGYYLIKTWIQERKIDSYYSVMIFISALGTLSALLSPGSEARLSAEIKTWYPNFESLSFVVKITKGYLETNRVLIVTSELAIIYLLLGAILVLAFLKRNYLSASISISVGFVIISQRLGTSNLLNAVQKIIDYQNQRMTEAFSFQENLYPLVIYSILLLALTIAVFMLFSDIWQAVSAVIILAVGYAARMTVALSPTIYASGLRTYTPLIFSGLILLVMFMREYRNTVCDR